MTDLALIGAALVALALLLLSTIRAGLAGYDAANRADDDSGWRPLE